MQARRPHLNRQISSFTLLFQEVKQSFKDSIDTVANDAGLRRVLRAYIQKVETVTGSVGGVVATSTKRTAGVSSRQSYGSAAHRIMQAGLKEVQHWLPLAAQRRCDDDGENVHHLRVSTRRADAAAKAFSDLADKDKVAALRQKLRQIRKAADAARDIDVNAERCASRVGTSSGALRAKLQANLCELRKQAQIPLVAIHAELSDGKFAELIRALLSELKTRHPKRAAQIYGKQARSILKPTLNKFFKAAQGGMSDDADIHRLRIQAKKLRYTMEIVAPAFAPAFGGKLYRQFCKYQDILGEIRDHVIAMEALRKWLAKPCDKQERAFLQGLLTAETLAHKELKGAFQMLWTKKSIEKLTEKFDELT